MSAGKLIGRIAKGKVSGLSFRARVRMVKMMILGTPVAIIIGLLVLITWPSQDCSTQTTIVRSEKTHPVTGEVFLDYQTTTRTELCE